jgi:hypothetical protein
VLCRLYVAPLRRDHSALDLTLKPNNHKVPCDPTRPNTNNILPFSVETIGWLDRKSKMARSSIQGSSGATIHRFGGCQPDLSSVCTIGHTPQFGCKASCHRSLAHYRVAGAAGLPERSVFADANAGGGQGRCRLVNIIILLAYVGFPLLVRLVSQKTPTVPRTTTTMAALSSDYDSVHPWESVTTSPDDYRIDLATPLEPMSDNSNWDSTASYAQLLYQVLKNAPEKTMKLCDIYDWFENNTDKADKGWKGSIRYNLSRNVARLLLSLPRCY